MKKLKMLTINVDSHEKACQIVRRGFVIDNLVNIVPIMVTVSNLVVSISAM